MSNEIFYGLKGSDYLTSDVCELFEANERIEWPITVLEYKQRKINHNDYSEYILDNLLKKLDEECENEKYTTATEDMKEAAKIFVEMVLDEYAPWSCVPTGVHFDYEKEEVLGRY